MVETRSKKRAREEAASPPASKKKAKAVALKDSTTPARPQATANQRKNGNEPEVANVPSSKEAKTAPPLIFKDLRGHQPTVNSRKNEPKTASPVASKEANARPNQDVAEPAEATTVDQSGSKICAPLEPASAVASKTTKTTGDDSKAAAVPQLAHVEESTEVHNPSTGQAIINARMNEASSKTRLHLLGLPAEIRNSIMELVLIEPTPVVLDAANRVRQPGALQVCKTLRHDYIKLYYVENQIEIILNDFNASAVQPAWDLVLRHNRNRPVNVIRWIRLNGAPDWANVKAWMSLMVAGSFGYKYTRPPTIRRGRQESWKVIISLICQAVRAVALSSMPMEEKKAVADQIAESFRPVLGAVDARWMQ